MDYESEARKHSCEGWEPVACLKCGHVGCSFCVGIICERCTKEKMECAAEAKADAIREES